MQFFYCQSAATQIFPPEHQMSVNPLLKIVPTVALFPPVVVLPLNHILILVLGLQFIHYNLLFGELSLIGCLLQTKGLNSRWVGLLHSLIGVCR